MEWNRKLHLLAYLPQFGTEEQLPENLRLGKYYAQLSHKLFLFGICTSTVLGRLSDQFYQVSNANVTGCDL